MAANRRTPAQREYDLQRIAGMYLKGKTQTEIGQEVGLSQPQVSYDLADIQRRWREDTTINIDEAKQRELSRIDELERTYWQAWEKSCNERTKTSTEKVSGDNGRAKASVQKEEMLGNPAFLAGVMSCIQERGKILGIYAPVKQENANTLIIDDPRDELLSRIGRLATRSGAESGDSGDDAG